ncbi:MAG: hypothetical protein HZA54_04410, partial [Planctomycetes bacterium]|nr:hypothetical protein [Planctomycetota bacterium]
MTCAEARARFLDALYGLADPAEEAQLAAHRAACAECARALAGLRERVAGLNAWKPEPPPAGLADRTVRRADGESKVQSPNSESDGSPAAELTGAGPATPAAAGGGTAARADEPSVPVPRAWAAGAAGRWVRFGRGLAAACAATLLVLLGIEGYVNSRRPPPQDTLVLGESEWLAGGPAALRVLVRDRRTLRPVAAARVAVTLERSAGSGLGGGNSESGESLIALGDFRTDAEGNAPARFDLPDLPAGEYRLAVRTESALGVDRVERTVRLRRGYTLMLACDKPLYQPGQTVHLRTLALRLPARRPAADAAAVFTATDARGFVVFRREVTTSEFGIAAVDLALADELNLGRWRLAVEVDGARSERTIEVRRYTPPRFRVELQPERRWVVPGAVVRGRVAADGFFGRPVDGAEVTVRAFTGDGPGAGGAEEGSGGEDGESAARIASAAGRTGADGAWTFELTLPPLLPASGAESETAVLLEAVVRDRAGREERRTARLRVTDEELRVVVAPGQSTLVPGVENEYFVLATYPDGTPATGNATLDFAAGDAVLPGQVGPLALDAAGAARFAASPPDRATRVIVGVTDAAGRSGRARCVLYGFSSFYNHVLRTDKAGYRVGETVKVQCVLPEAEEGTIHLDVLAGRQTVLTRTARIVAGRAELEFRASAELAGTLELQAWRVAQKGDWARETRLIQVTAADELAIEARLDRATYRPGEEAGVRLRVRGADGRPVRAALGLAAVDEAVLALAAAGGGLGGAETAAAESAGATAL